MVKRPNEIFFTLPMVMLASGCITAQCYPLAKPLSFIKKERQGNGVIAQHKVLSFKYIPHSGDGSGWGYVWGVCL